MKSLRRSVILRRLVTLVTLLIASCGFGLALPVQWIEARSEHFHVLTDSTEKQARRIMDEFERMRWTFHTLFPNADIDPVEPIFVIAASNQRVFRRLSPPLTWHRGK
jgi:hypothetical protein